jgi:hypothetical protein
LGIALNAQHPLVFQLFPQVGLELFVRLTRWACPDFVER